MAVGDLTPNLVARATLILMSRQIRDVEAPFRSWFVVRIPREALTLSLSHFEEDYINEAADTLMCVQREPGPMPNPSWWHRADSALVSFSGIELSVVRDYDARNDRRTYRFDAKYQQPAVGNPAQRKAA